LLSTSLELSPPLTANVGLARREWAELTAHAATP